MRASAWCASSAGRREDRRLRLGGVRQQNAKPQATSTVQIIRDLQPALDFDVDVVQAGDGEAVRDAVLLRLAAGVDQPAADLLPLERQPEVDARPRRRLDLCN